MSTGYRVGSKMHQIMSLGINEKVTFVAKGSAQALRVDINRKNKLMLEEDRKRFRINETFDKGVRYLTVTRLKKREIFKREIRDV